MAQASYKEIREALSKREPFTGNSMWSKYVDPKRSLTTGELPPEDVRWLEADAKMAYETMESLYVVWSYQTPIAWAYGDTVRVPDVKYSVTTSKQQTYASAYLR
jgi:hypothetical protein